MSKRELRIIVLTALMVIVAVYGLLVAGFTQTQQIVLDHVDTQFAGMYQTKHAEETATATKEAERWTTQFAYETGYAPTDAYFATQLASVVDEYTTWESRLHMTLTAGAVVGQHNLTLTSAR